MKTTLTTSILSLFVTASFAQQNLQDVTWSSASTSLPALEANYDGYNVSGDLDNKWNYFASGAQTQEDAKNYYINFGNFTNSTSARIFVGENGTTTPSYYGNITSVISSDITLNRYTAGSFARADTSVGDVNTTINGNVNLKSALILGGGYVETAGVTLTQKSTTLTLNNGSYNGNMFANGFLKSGIIKTTNGSSLVINNATVYAGGDYMIGGGTLAYNAGSKSVIENGTKLYLGSGAVINAGVEAFGGSDSYGGAITEITGGSSVVVEGATSHYNIYGGSNSSGNNGGYAKVDNTSVTVLSGTINGGVYGGSLTQVSGATIITGNTNVDIKGGTLADVFGGSWSWENGTQAKENTVIEGSTNVKISGGTITSNVFGGSNASTDSYGYGADTKILGNTNVEISDDAIIEGAVIGGSLAVAGTNKTGYNLTSNIAGSTNITITGGQVKGEIVAGSYAIDTYSTAEIFEATVNSAKVVVSGGIIEGDILAGGIGAASVIENNSEVIFIGNGSDITFTGNVFGGSVENSQILGETIISFGDGETAFTGAFNGVIDTMDTVAVESNSDVTIINAFTATNLIVQTDSKANLAENTTFDTLTIAFYEELSENSSTGFDMAEIFGDSTSVVLSAIENGNAFTVVDANGNEFEATYEKGIVEVGTKVIPEPSTYAAILGALALAFVAYRKRK